MPFGLYIHIPFCRSKCPYCAFVSTPGLSGLHASYIDALATEYAQTVTDAPRTIYIGGGTPTVLAPELLAGLLKTIDSSAAEEFTCEANPESFTPDTASVLAKHGVDRLSIGAQSFDDKLLKHLGRIHTAEDTARALVTARTAGFDSISIDLMFGVPGQTMKSWRSTLERALSFHPEHISSYSLSVEEDTAYFKLFESGGLDLPSAELAADMYETAVDYLAANGYERYEISNFSLPGRHALHNESYWDFTPYVGLGTSAHSFDGTRRYWNTSDIESYISCVLSGKPPIAGEEHIDPESRKLERIMLGLRTSSGIVLSDIGPLSDAAKDELVNVVGYLVDSNLALLDDGGRLRLTVKGSLIADEIIGELFQAIQPAESDYE